MAQIVQGTQFTQTTQTTQTTSDVRLIDVSNKPATAKVVREGYQVPAVQYDVQKASFLVNQLVTVTPGQLPRVIAQSAPPGTKVTAGTVVDLVLAPKDAVPFDMFSAEPADLKGKYLPVLDPLLDNPSARQILLANENPSDVSATDKQTLTTALKAVGVNVDDTDPTRTFALAYGAARNALAFR